MKKIITTIISLGIMLPAFALAATFSVTPNKTSYNVGENIILNISVNGEGSNIYTANLISNFSTSTLSVVSFTMNDNMLPLKQNGYDLIDNQNGGLIKTGGYAGGTASSNFGTLILRAQNIGQAELNISESSKLLDENNINKISGRQSISFNIIAKPIVKGEYTSNISTSTEATTTTIKIENPDQGFTAKNIITMILIIILLIIVIIYFYRYRKDK